MGFRKGGRHGQVARECGNSGSGKALYPMHPHVLTERPQGKVLLRCSLIEKAQSDIWTNFRESAALLHGSASRRPDVRFVFADRRVLYSHSAPLRSRSIYFERLFSSQSLDCSLRTTAEALSDLRAEEIDCEDSDLDCDESPISRNSDATVDGSNAGEPHQGGEAMNAIDSLEAGNKHEDQRPTKLGEILKEEVATVKSLQSLPIAEAVVDWLPEEKMMTVVIEDFA